MARIVRLTESDLIRLVKRIINEGQPSATTPQNTTPTKNFKQMANTLYRAISGIGTDEGAISGVLNQIKTREEFNTVSNEFKRIDGKSNLLDSLTEDLGKSEWDSIVVPFLKRIGYGTMVQPKTQSKNNGIFGARPPREKSIVGRGWVSR